MNKDLLFQLYAIHSPSGSEKKMRRFLRKQAAACGATSIETDPHGNLLIVKGESDTYPCLAAHMDQVQKAHSKDFCVVEVNGDVLGWSAKCHEQQGLGADDKNGIFICLELLRKFDVMKVAFFVGEEVGCQGSSEVDLSFFKDCRFIVEPDRMHGNDLITSMFCGEVCSKDFIDAIGYKAYGYEEERGSITDVGTLVERGVGISCLNLSCGYYDAHTDNEITVLPELENCLNFVAHIVETCTDVYPFEESYGGWYGGYSYYGSRYTKHWYNNYDGLYLDGYQDGKSGASSTKTAQSSPSQYDDDPFVDDAYQYYYDSGQYDEDFDKMCELIGLDPHMRFDDVEVWYYEDFYAPITFGRKYGLDMLRELYNDAKDLCDYNESVDKDSDELSFEEVNLQKVS